MADSSPQLLSVVGASLIASLNPRDVISLLATCKKLRSDAEAVALAFESNAIARHFYRGCSRDWCVPASVFDPEGPRVCEVHGAAPSPTPTDRRVVVPGGRFAPAARLARRVGVLSLAELMYTQLNGILYSVHTTPLHEYSVVPFILPLGHPNEIEAKDPEPGLVSGVGYHWETFVTQETVTCRFCESIEPAIEQFFAKTEEYHSARQIELDELEQTWRDEGYGSDSDEFKARASAFDDRKSESDAKYNQNYLDASQEEIVEHLCEYDFLPHFDIFGEDADAVAALVEASETSITDRLCAQVLRPLARFFQSNKFSRVCRGRSQEKCETTEAARTSKVEMVGGIAPHGFYAGVYISKLPKVRPLQDKWL